nr:NADH dehydrogenase subunit 3 [Nothopoda sp.]
MNFMFYELMTTFVMISILSILFYILNKHENWDNLTSMIFECGYSSFNFFRYSFSSHYFIIAMIFLFLDLEFCFILPIIYMNNFNMKSFTILVFVIFMVLLSLFMEMKNNSLNWKN